MSREAVAKVDPGDSQVEEASKRFMESVQKPRSSKRLVTNFSNLAK